MTPQTLEYLSHLTTLTAQPIYLVGGSVRDLLSGVRDIKDIDLLIPSGSEDVARAFADSGFDFIGLLRQLETDYSYTAWGRRAAQRLQARQ